MSKMTLEEFFESVRPGKYDMCVIVKAVLDTLKKGVQVMLDTEHISYDSYNGKVYLLKCGTPLSVERYREDICGFFSLLNNVCRHAGDNTGAFMQTLCGLVRREDYNACMDAVSEYILFCREKRSNNFAIHILCVVTVIVYELIILTAMHVRFY